MINDILYYASLLLCVSLGSYYKRTSGTEIKRICGAAVGMLVACLICGHHVYHTVFMVWGNIIIIKCDKRYVHQLSFLYTWIYLMYLHIYSTSIHVIWIHQTMALRLVGLAFEMKSSLRSNFKSISSLKAPTVDNMEDSVEPSVVDIIVYTYFFVGLHRGPYFRWKTYHDYFSSSFGGLGEFRIITEHKIKKAVAFLIAFILLQRKFPPQIYYENDFYDKHGSDYRYLYNVPQLFMFFLHYQMIMLLCTSVCTEAGFGVYPVKCKALPGHGPSAQSSLLKITVGNHDIAMGQEYNFAMLKCFDNYKLLMGPKMNSTLRGWDMPTRYWFWSNIYKNLLKANKEVRSACSFFAWTVWCGPSIQQCILSATLWVYIQLEEEYSAIYNTTGHMKAAWNIGFSMMRLFCLIYLTPCFTVTDTSAVLRYYNSIFWIFHLLLFILLVGAIVAYKSKRT